VEAAVRAFALLALAACSVPEVSLEGKKCPCAGAYSCGSDNLCHAKSDGGVKDDVLPPTSCLGSAPGASLYSGFASTFLTMGGTWTQGASLQQTDAASGLAFAYINNASLDVATYRIVTHVTGTAGGTAMGISLRITGKPQYDCLWEPGTAGTLLWQSVNNGGNAANLATPLTALPTSSEVTMEVLATPTMLVCCIDNIAAAKQTVTNPSPSYPMGLPGVAVVDMKATFDQFEVFAN
jgi:hypothetical protein